MPTISRPLLTCRGGRVGRWADRVAGEIGFDPVVELLERRALEADPGAAEAGAIVIVVAAGAL